MAGFPSKTALLTVSPCGRYTVIVYRSWLITRHRPEFANKAVKTWLEHSGVKTLFVALGSPWENGYIESFNGRLRDELLNRELFLSINELKYVVDRWRMDYNHYRPHSSLDYMAPAAFAAMCLEQGSATLCLTQDKENMCEILS